jgi:hypothetical protein
MAYKKADMIKQCLNAIEENNLFFIEDIIAYVSFGKTTFYAHKLNESNDIKKALENNRIRMKINLRKNWADSKFPALQIALYRLLATEEEFKRLIQQRFDHTSMGERIQPIEFTLANPETKNKIKKLIDESKLN